jgi:hypothetical protein
MSSSINHLKINTLKIARYLPIKINNDILIIIGSYLGLHPIAELIANMDALTTHALILDMYELNKRMTNSVFNELSKIDAFKKQGDMIGHNKTFIQYLITCKTLKPYYYCHHYPEYSIKASGNIWWRIFPDRCRIDYISDASYIDSNRIKNVFDPTWKHPDSIANGSMPKIYYDYRSNQWEMQEFEDSPIDTTLQDPNRVANAVVSGIYFDYRTDLERMLEWEEMYLYEPICSRI